MARDREKEERNERAKKAILAMKAMGIPVQKAKPVLKQLLKEFDNNLEYIEADNYSVLVDALIAGPDFPDAGTKKDVAVQDEQLENSRKRSRAKEDDQASASVCMPNIPRENEPGKSTLEDDDSPQLQLRRRRMEPPAETMHLQLASIEKASSSVQPQGNEGDERAVVPVQVSDARQPGTVGPEIGPAMEVADTSGSLITFRRSKRLMESNVGSPVSSKDPKSKLGRHSSVAKIRPKDEPLDEGYPTFEPPIAVMPPPQLRPTGNKEAQQDLGGPVDVSTGNGSISHMNPSESGTSQPACEGKDAKKDQAGRHGSKVTAQELANVQDASAKHVEIASSTSGEVKITLACSHGSPAFEMPDLESIFKMVEDRCLKSYRILQPDFSLRNIMTEICQCVVELSSKTTEGNENNVNVVPVVDPLKRSFACSVLRGTPEVLNRSPLTMPQGSGLMSLKVVNSNGRDRSRNELGCQESSNALEHQQLQLANIRPLHDTNDITKGEERVRVSVINEVNSETFPPSFNYIPQNLVYQHGHIDFSLARIGDEDCCADCFGDCLSVSIPCACARETGGEFAYTSDGLIKKEFLDECISMNMDPQKHKLFYCTVCPLERSKNKVKPGSCNGHLVRKFVKECWSKCGCSKQCGNRVVQRGITCNLQVFYTPDGKGWGLRTLDDLPRGAFVCEYVGEIVTNLELYDRTVRTTGSARHTYPVLLDADWGSECVLKDEEALCLDATFYGNVGRFVNHRCNDANLIEIPIEVETPDHHYYHLAFFTTRKVEAFEELTWDYGIDFDDQNHPIKAFRCCCGSRYCRDKKRSRAKSAASASK